jgi:hypothetical protein
MLPVSGAEQLNTSLDQGTAAHDLGERRVFQVGKAGAALRMRQEQVPQPGRARLGLQLLHDRHRLPAVGRPGVLLVVQVVVGEDVLVEEAQQPGAKLLDPFGIAKSMALSPPGRREKRSTAALLTVGAQRASAVPPEQGGCHAARRQPAFRASPPREGARVKAVLCRAFGPPSGLTLEEVPAPRPGPGQVLIRVEACAVNFPDTLIIQGRYQTRPPLPFSPGGEVAGVVAGLGDGAAGPPPGTRVLAMTSHGGFAEMAVAGAHAVVAVPEDVDAVTAAALSYAYGTTLHALRDRAALRPGETVLVSARRVVPGVKRHRKVGAVRK